MQKICSKVYRWRVNLLEEEVILNELGLSLLVHSLKRVEGSLKVWLLEGLKSCNNRVHHLESLSLRESRAKREVSEVSADSDSGGDDHLGVLLGEGRGVELGGVHVGDVAGGLAVLVVVLDDLVEEGREDLVRVVRARVAANARIGVLAAREDSLAEGKAELVLLVLQGEPNLLRQVLRKKRLSAFGENGEVLDVLGLGEVRANEGGLSVVELEHLLSVLTS